MEFPPSGLGIWQLLTSEVVTDLIGTAGFDITLLDFEHGLFDQQTLQRTIYAAKSKDLFTIARVPSPSYSTLPQIIDTGVDGILFSNVHSLQQLTQISSDSLLPPIGNRSYSPFVSRFSYGADISDYKMNPKIGIIIESLKSFESLDSILSYQYLDFIYFGAYDLSAELSSPGDIFSDRLLSYLSKLINTSVKFNKPILSIYRTPDELRTLLKLGVTHPISMVDTHILLKALSSEVVKYSGLI